MKKITKLPTPTQFRKMNFEEKRQINNLLIKYALKYETGMITLYDKFYNNSGHRNNFNKFIKELQK